MSIYIAITDQTDPKSGAVDFFLGTPLNLNLVKDLIETGNDAEFTIHYGEKVQLLMGINEGIMFAGNIYHMIHGNTSTTDRLSIYYVLEINNSLDVINEYQINNSLVDINWDKYELNEMEWITKRSDFIDWNNNFIKQTIAIDWSKLWQFKNNHLMNDDDEKKDKE